jgi:hypothetical protein
LSKVNYAPPRPRGIEVISGYTVRIRQGSGKSSAYYRE